MSSKVLTFVFFCSDFVNTPSFSRYYIDCKKNCPIIRSSAFSQPNFRALAWKIEICASWKPRLSRSLFFFFGRYDGVHCRKSWKCLCLVLWGLWYSQTMLHAYSMDEMTQSNCVARQWSWPKIISGPIALFTELYGTRNAFLREGIDMNF